MLAAMALLAIASVRAGVPAASMRIEMAPLRSGALAPPCAFAAAAVVPRALRIPPQGLSEHAQQASRIQLSAPADARRTIRLGQYRMAAGGARDSDAVVFMPGASPQARTQSKRFEQWYAAPNAASAAAAEEAQGAVGTEGETGPLSGLEQLTVLTERSLDWLVVKTALANCSKTPMGRRALASMAPLTEVAEVERAYNALEEVRRLADQGVSLPLSQVRDIVALAGVAGKGDVLDLEELKDCAGTLVAMLDISKELDGRNDTATLTDIAQGIDLNPDIVRLFERSFDASGQLSIREYPQLDLLRKEILQIEKSVTTTMDSLVKDPSFASTLQDKFYTIRENRFVLPVAITNKNKVSGIVHGMSGTGSTVYIEPQQVIDLNNRLRLAQGELKAEEQRIRTMLSQKLGSQARQIRLATSAVVEMDCASARENLGATMAATRPLVGEGNEVLLTRARHPVLVLRGVKPVPNSVQLTANRPALVISGPNAGGKTVVLKTVGLCALLVQHGCFVPCEEGSRVDLFANVLASIGDQQTVEEDLSSFSSHMKTLNAMVENGKERSLILLDEICSGTDPAQGSALAQAILERLLDQGNPRMVITTHYGQLKALATVDDRFSVAAMQYVNGAPSYKMVEGVTGESHALSIAKKMGITQDLLDRASLLMGEQAKMTKTLEALEEQRARALELADGLERERRDMQAKMLIMEKREKDLIKRSKALEAAAAADFVKRANEAENSIKAIVRELQQSGGSFKDVEEARAKIGTLQAGVLRGLEQEQSEQEPDLEIRQGDSVMLLDIGSEGVVLQAPSKNGDVQVKVGPLSMKTKLDRLRKITGLATPKPQGGVGGGGRMGSMGGKKPPAGKKAYQDRLANALRTPANTLDLRGFRAEDVGQTVDKFLDKMSMAGQPSAFLLSGHGTGAVCAFFYSLNLFVIYLYGCLFICLLHFSPNHLFISQVWSRK